MDKLFAYTKEKKQSLHDNAGDAKTAANRRFDVAYDKSENRIQKIVDSAVKQIFTIPMQIRLAKGYRIARNIFISAINLTHLQSKASIPTSESTLKLFSANPNVFSLVRDFSGRNVCLCTFIRGLESLSSGFRTLNRPFV